MSEEVRFWIFLSKYQCSGKLGTGVGGYRFYPSWGKVLKEYYSERLFIVPKGLGSVISDL